MPSGKKKRATGINKKDLTEKLALHGGIPKIGAAEYIDILTGIISEALLDGKKVTISDFGTFNLSERAAFHGYDPRNEKRIHVPRRVIPVFRAGKQLKCTQSPPHSWLYTRWPKQGGSHLFKAYSIQAMEMF